MDVVMSVKKITDDITLPVENVNEVFGGTAGNFTKIALKISLPFRLYSIVSSISHNKYLDFLIEKGFDMNGIVISDDDFGPVCYAVNDGKEQRYFMAEGPMKRLSYRILDEKYDYLHLGTGNPELNYQLMEGCSYERLSFDPSQEIFYKYSAEQIRDFMNRSDFIMGNENEIKFMKDRTGIDFKEIAGMGKIIVMTRGSSGCTVIGGSSFSVPAYGKVEDGDTLGAGDSFRAGFYYGLYNNLTLEESVACGNVVSYFVVLNGLNNFNVDGRRIIEMGKELSKKVIYHNGDLRI